MLLTSATALWLTFCRTSPSGSAVKIRTVYVIRSCKGKFTCTVKGCCYRYKSRPISGCIDKSKLRTQADHIKRISLGTHNRIDSPMCQLNILITIMLTLKLFHNYIHFPRCDLHISIVLYMYLPKRILKIQSLIVLILNIFLILCGGTHPICAIWIQCFELFASHAVRSLYFLFRYCIFNNFTAFLFDIYFCYNGLDISEDAKKSTLHTYDCMIMGACNWSTDYHEGCGVCGRDIYHSARMMVIKFSNMPATSHHLRYHWTLLLTPNEQQMSNDYFSNFVYIL